MDDRLLAQILDRLDRASLDGAVEAYVLAACLGRLDELAAGEGVARPELAPAVAAEPVGAYLQKITVQGFRGIGERRALTLEPGPGLTLVVGRNGSGKSSFAEALEIVLTGENRRWSERSQVWKDAWRNLHAPHPVQLQVELVEEDRAQPTLLTRGWAAGAGLDDAATTVRRAGGDDEPFAVLGWDDDLVRYRPVLSYRELGAILDARPTELYDAVAALLGVDEARDAAKALGARRLADEKTLRAAKAALPPLLDELRASDDERAVAIAAALSGRSWDLDGAEAHLLDDESAAGPVTATLQALAGLQAPDPAAVAALADRLDEAAQQRAAAAASDAGRAARVAALLDAAVTCVTHDGAQPCPVCGSGVVLDEGWVGQARAEAEALRAQAEQVRAADAALRGAVEDARRLCSPVPPVLARSAGVGVDAALLTERWTAWAQLPEEPNALAVHLRAAAASVAEAAQAVCAAALEELDRRQARWRPLAVRFAAWVAEARDALAADARSKQLKRAETWLGDTVRAIEVERFAPIRDRTVTLWEQLRLDSNVRLDEVAMRSSGPRRHLALDVAVDDSEASALGVMSQGELHALALSVFLPRATLDASPFRFVVIDDPVQAMDPARVDGLARVLSAVAATRQVVVFTHDARLPEAVRRLQLPALVFEVTRRPQSRVEVREVSDPIERVLEDARAVALTTDLDPALTERVVPGLCREAVEAACARAVRRRRLRRGERHDDVEQLLDGARTTNDLAALALHDDRGAGGAVLSKLNQWGRDHADVYQWCRQGAHAPPAGLTMVEGVDRVVALARKIAALP
jgi:recombinational DNA repair ATPase RecF